MEQNVASRASSTQVTVLVEQGSNRQSQVETSVITINTKSETDEKMALLSAKLKKMKEEALKKREEKEKQFKQAIKLKKKSEKTDPVAKERTLGSTFKIKMKSVSNRCLKNKTENSPKPSCSKVNTTSEKTDFSKQKLLPSTSKIDNTDVKRKRKMPKNKITHETSEKTVLQSKDKVIQFKKANNALKTDSETKRLKEMAAERKRRQRERIRTDPEAYEKEKEKEKEKERQRYQKRKAEGKIKLISERTTRDQKSQRIRWRINNCRYYERKKQGNNTSLTNTLNSTKSQIGRKKVAASRSFSARKLLKKEIECKNLEAKANKWKQKYYRLKNKPRTDSVPKNSPTPSKKVEQILKIADKEQIKKKLLFGEVLSSQIKMNAKLCSTLGEKETLATCVSGSLFKKYKVMSTAQTILSPYMQKKAMDPGKKIVCDKKKRNTIAKKAKQAIQNFLEEDENSTITPGKKTTVTKNGIKKQKRLMNSSLQKLHKTFLSRSEYNISFRTFCRQKPFWIVNSKLSARDTCLCVKHANFKFIMERLRHHRIININSISQLSENMCCNTALQTCMYRQCKKCKNKTVLNELPNLDNSATIFYHQWTTSTETRTIKGKEVNVKITSKQRIRSSVEELIKTFEGEVPKILQHSYRVWHQTQFSKTLKEVMDQDEVSVTIDFSENYVLKYSSEVQSVHFGASKVQLSLHTGAFYYKEPSSMETVCQTFCSVSSSTRHDPSAIWAHLQPVVNLIKTQVPNVKKIHVLSDGPTTQYRNKKNFFLFAHFCKELNISNATWNFSESGHGKSVADGVGGLVKRTADKSVAQGRDVSSIEEFVECIKDVKCIIFVIKEEEIIKIDSLLKDKELKTIPNTMKLHQIVWDISNSKRLYLRDLSCIDCRNQPNCDHHKGITPNIHEFSEKKTKPEKKKKTKLSNKTEQSEQKNYVDGDWVAVVFGKIWYPGCVIAKTKDKLSIKFMDRSKYLFFWPHKDDIQVINQEGVLCSIKSPIKVSTRFFKVDNSEEVDLLNRLTF